MFLLYFIIRISPLPYFFNYGLFCILIYGNFARDMPGSILLISPFIRFLCCKLIKYIPKYIIINIHIFNGTFFIYIYAS